MSKKPKTPRTPRILKLLPKGLPIVEHFPGPTYIHTSVPPEIKKYLSTKKRK